MSEIIGGGVEDAGAVRSLDEAVRRAQDLLGVAPVRGHDARGQLGALPQILVIGLGRRDVEALVQPVLEAAQDLPLVFQGLAAVQMQLPRDEANDHRSRPLGAAPRLERARDLLDAIRLDQVSHFDVVEVLDADAALEALADLAGVVLEPLQRRDGPFVHLDAVADDADARGPRNHAAADVTSRDRAHFRDLEYLPDFRLPQHHFLLFGRQQARHRRAHFFDRLVEDPVCAYL